MKTREGDIWLEWFAMTVIRLRYTGHHWCLMFYSHRYLVWC